METDVQNPLSSLLKEKFGISEVKSSLQFTEKDTLFTIFRKTANYIYKNADWSVEEQEKAIKSLLESTGQGLVETVEADKKPIKEDGTEYIPGTRGNTIYRVKYSDPTQQSKEHYVVLDKDNKNWSHQGERRIYRDDRPLDWIEGNLNYTLGYGKLTADLVKSFERNKENKLFEIEDLHRLLYRLTCSQYGSKKYSRMFNQTALGNLTHDEFVEMTEKNATSDKNLPVEEERRTFTTQALEDNPALMPWIGRNITLKIWKETHDKNQLLQYVKDYLQETYNLVQQRRYEQDLNKVVRAKAWIEKKQINSSTREMMEKTKLNDDFKEIELDNDVDLKSFLKFEAESHHLMQALPKATNKEVPTLRLRKLGNYNALGMYVPMVNTMVVDFRKTDQVYQSVKKDQGERALGSFVHEYGHYLDSGLSKNGYTKSLEKDFAHILNGYQGRLKELSGGQLTAKELDYFTTPTEVFARGFELWVKEHNQVHTNLVHPSKYYDVKEGKIQYKAFDNELREKLFTYMDKIPEFQITREKLINKDFSKEIPKELKLKPEVRNEQELADKKKLEAFSWQVLHKWTKTPERLEKLIKATNNSLQENNPNRLMWFDKYQTEKLPQMVPEKELIKHGFPIQDYQVEGMYGFVKVDNTVEKDGKDRYVAGLVYNLNELKEAVRDNEKDLKTLQNFEKKEEKPLRSRADLDYLQGVNSEQVPEELKDKPLAKTFMRLEDHFLTASVVQQNQTEFSFSEQEKELLKNEPRLLERLYLDSLKKSKDTKKGILTQMKEPGKFFEQSNTLQKAASLVQQGPSLSR